MENYRRGRRWYKFVLVVSDSANGAMVARRQCVHDCDDGRTCPLYNFFRVKA